MQFHNREFCVHITEAWINVIKTLISQRYLSFYDKLHHSASLCVKLVYPIIIITMKDIVLVEVKGAPIDMLAFWKSLPSLSSLLGSFPIPELLKHRGLIT